MVSNVFLLRYARRPARDGWEFLQQAADREGISVNTLFDEVRVQPKELSDPVLT